MNPLHAELVALVEAAGERGIPLVVIGAFAVRAYLVAPDRRETRDMDFVVAEPNLAALRTLLEGRGYRVYEARPWWHAERGAGSDRRVIDVGVGAVVDMTTFDRYELDPTEATAIAEPGARALPVPSLEDVLAMKLLAHRDKDILDVAALLRDAGSRLDIARFVRRVEDRDAEIPIRRGYLAVVASAESGDLARLWTLRSGAPLPPEVLAKVLERLHTVFA